MLLCRRWEIRWWSCSRRSSRRLSWTCAGYRRAQDLLGPNPTAFCGTSYSDCGAVGGSANLDMRWQSLPRSSIRGVRFVVFSQDKVQQRLVQSSSLTLQFLRVGRGGGGRIHKNQRRHVCQLIPVGTIQCVHTQAGPDTAGICCLQLSSSRIYGF